MNMSIVKINVGKPGVKGSKVVQLDPNNGTIKLASMKKMLPVPNAFATMPKGDARKVRKSLHAAGYGQFAAMRRAA
jgi:hypothetical protein